MITPNLGDICTFEGYQEDIVTVIVSYKGKTVFTISAMVPSKHAEYSFSTFNFNVKIILPNQDTDTFNPSPISSKNFHFFMVSPYFLIIL